jgi:K+/H+ antiporter YhaU regulatory subunit KhtT
VLKEFAIPDNVIDQQVAMIRAGHYGMLRGREMDKLLRGEWRQMLEAAVTQTFYVAADSPACGQTVRELDLRNRTGVTIVAVTRDGRPIPSPKIDFEFQAGDVLVLVGTHHGLDRARRALSARPAEA